MIQDDQLGYQQGLYPVIGKYNLAKNVYDLHIEAKELVANAYVGQFVHIKVRGFFLRRPISICQVDPQTGFLRLVFEVRGEGTRALSEINTGEMIDLLGPLGRGFSLLSEWQPSDRILVIGGGIGVPPLLDIAKFYGSSATAILGFQTAKSVILEEDFGQYKNQVIICTNDGTSGEKGLVTHPFQQMIKEQSVKMIYGCGPKGMLQAVTKLANERGIACEVSLEEHMACGVGACLGCACLIQQQQKKEYLHVCKHGPVFKGEQVVFDED